MADSILIEKSTENQNVEEPFVKKEVVFVVDQNGSNYNGTIQLDSSSLANSGKYQSWSEAYLEIPLVVTLSSSVAANAAALNAIENPFGVALKNGFHQLIHSISVEYNNTSVVQLTSFSNFYVSFKLMTQLSQDDLKKHGTSLGFYPDTASSFNYNANVAANGTVRYGTGVRNNANLPAFDTVARYTNVGAYNKGMNQRQKNTSFEITAPSSSFIDANTAGQIGKNYYVAGAGYKAWYVMARIHLKHLHDFFNKIPLVRGGYVRMIINTNTATHTIRLTKHGAGTNVSCPSSIIQGGTSPLMFASGEANQGNATFITGVNADGGIANGDVDYTLRLSIGKDTSLNLTHPTFGAQTRLYIPIYTMNEIPTEQNYLSLVPTKQVVYEDIYSYQTNVDAGATFNVLLSNGIPGIKAVVVIPILQASANPLGVAGTIPTAPHQSPFASEPATTSPLVALRNFNVQISGQNMFLQNQDYDFSQFMDELQSFNALNGALTPGLTSGLIGEHDFATLYRYYVADCSRRLQSEDQLPKSVVISGQNKCLLAVTLYTFIVFQRKITVNTADGSLVQT